MAHKHVHIRASQKPPYLKPLPYAVYGDDCPALPASAFGFGSYETMSRMSPAVIQASNKALDKMVDMTEQAADLIVAFRERQKSIDMITDGLSKLVNIAKAIRKKDPKLLRKVVYGKSSPEAKMILSRPANIWLAYHFGIVPTIMDVHHAAGVLGLEFPALEVQTTAIGHHDESRDYGSYTWRYNHVTTSRVKLGGEVTSVNANLVLAGQLGFTSPLSMVWEMTPFSWFVDYFVNVGDLLSNLEPRFPGIKFQNQYTTVFTDLEAWAYYNQYSTGSLAQAKEQGGQWFQGSAYCVNRTIGWPNKRLDISGIEALNLKRASYVAAVLVTILSGFKR